MPMYCVEFKKELYLVRTMSQTCLTRASHPPPFSHVKQFRVEWKQSLEAP